MNRTFTINDEQAKMIDEFITEQNLKAIQQQKDKVTPDDSFYQLYKDCWDTGYAYGGAIGGILTYSFTPTSVGEALVVRHNLTGEAINLSNYNNW